MGRERRAAASRSVCERLAGLESVAAASSLIAYWPGPAEVDIRHFLVNAVSEGRSVFLPKVAARGRPLEFHNISHSGLILSTGYGGIMEPALESQGFAAEKGACVLVPAVSVDRSGNRLGSGLGFYDITIAAMPEVTLVAPLFSCQLAESLPSEAHDMKVSAAVTEDATAAFPGAGEGR